MLSNRDTAPEPTSWESLARHARSLADLADQCAAMSPAALAPVDGSADRLAELDARARNMVSLAAACRRATWQALADQGMDGAAIGRLWGKQRSTVGKALKAPHRPR